MILMGLLLPACVGGLLLAGVLGRLNRRPSSGPVAHDPLEPMSPDLINMAHIRIAGLGGLGMLGAALVTAVSLPAIGLALAVGVGLGAAGAAALVAYRSRTDAAGRGHDGPPPTVFALEDRTARIASRPRHGAHRAPLAVTA